jgi:hypothetical protein
MNMFRFFQIASESGITRSEVEAFAAFLDRSHAGVSVQDVDVRALVSFLDKYQATYRKIKMSDLFQLGRERFGEPEPGVDAAIELFCLPAPSDSRN